MEEHIAKIFLFKEHNKVYVKGEMSFILNWRYTLPFHKHNFRETSIRFYKPNMSLYFQTTQSKNQKY